MVLIELYDAREPIHNVISMTAFRPDTMVLLVRGERMRQQAEINIKRFAAKGGLQTNVEWVICQPFDLATAEHALEQVVKRYGAQNCVIDVIGGDEVLLLAAGSCAKGKDSIRIVSCRQRSEEFIWIKGEPIKPLQKVAWPLAQLIALAGGELVRNARASDALKQPAFIEIIPKVFSVYMKHRDSWPEFVLYMQQVKQKAYQARQRLCCTAPRVYYVGRRRIDPHANIFHDLQAAGALTAFTEEEENYRMQFASEAVQKYLCDVGAWLELYGYYMLNCSAMFDEVQMSAVISWDDDTDKQDVINEIDLVALTGPVQLFISCKTALPDNMVLHEIATLTQRFGTSRAIPMLITAANLEKEAPSVYRRAAEMGIAVFDAEDLREDRFTEKLQTLLNHWVVRKEEV